MLLIHPVTELTRALPALAGVFFAGHAGGHGLITSLLVAVGVVALSVTRWFTTRLLVTDEQVQLRHGLLRRRTVATRRDRIRTVDVTAHVLHRALGLSRVVVGTGTSDRKNEARIVLDGLTVGAAEALRRELLHRSATAPAHPVGEAAATELARLHHRWIVLAPFTLSGVVTGLVVWGFVWRVQGESGVDLLHSGPLRSVGHGLDTLPTALAVLMVIAAVVVFVAVTSVVGYLLAFWNFRLMRHEDGTLQVTRGLLTTRATSIERRRLVGVEISRPLSLRAVGGARTLSVATGLRVGRGAEKGGEVLLPPAPVSASRSVAGQVLATGAEATGTGVTGSAVTATLHPHGRAATRRRYARALGGGVVLVVAAAVGWRTGGSFWAVPVALALLMASVPLAADRASSLGHAHVDGALVTRYGSLLRRRVVLADHAVIGWTVRATWFQRRVGVSTLTATTAAGRQSYRVVDVETPTGVALADGVTPGLLGPFLAAPSSARPTHPATAR